MKLETKYNIGDDLYLLWSDSPKHGEISEIKVIYAHGEIEIEYRLAGYFGQKEEGIGTKKEWEKTRINALKDTMEDK